MTEAELRQVLENIVCSNLFLRLENDIFERYLARRDPESLQSNFFIQFIFISSFSEILKFHFKLIFSQIYTVLALTFNILCLEIAQILETAKRVQRIAPQQDRISPVISVTGSLVNVRDRDSVSIVSLRSGSRHVTPSLLTARAPTGGTKSVR